MWEPAITPKPGDRIEFRYREHWTMDADPAQAGGHVVATRSGVHDWQPDQRTVIVEFTGNGLNKPSEIPLTADIKAIGDNAEKIKFQGINVQSMPEDHWRLSFQIAPTAEGAKLTDCGPVELRCCLKGGDNFLTETWAYRINP